MNRWFRHYAGLARDDKIVRVALSSKQSIERVVWVWCAILESAAEINDGGRYDIDASEVAYFLRADEVDIRAVLDGLTSAARVAEGAVVKWGDRQFQSDRSAARQSAYRERKRSRESHRNDQQEESDARVTSPSRHRDAPETDTDTEKEKKETRKEVREKEEEVVVETAGGASATNLTPTEIALLVIECHDVHVEDELAGLAEWCDHEDIVKPNERKRAISGALRKKQRVADGGRTLLASREEPIPVSAELTARMRH